MGELRGSECWTIQSGPTVVCLDLFDRAVLMLGCGNWCNPSLRRLSMTCLRRGVVIPEIIEFPPVW
jgi:hypothetical protein